MKTLNPANPTNSGSYSQAQVDTLIAVAKPKMDLLWENPDPDSAFAEQTITVPASEYDILLIGAYGLQGSYSVAIGTGTGQLRFANRWTSGSTTNYEDHCRNFSVTEDSVFFSIGLLHEHTTTYNKLLVPYRIYGIKF
jgi:hypothetical protein